MPEATPPTAGGDQPQQAPMGVSSATGPTPNKGYEAAVIQRLGSIVPALYEMLPMAGASSDIGKAISKALESLSKFVPPGASNAASQQNDLKRQLMQNQQNAQMQQQARPQMPGQGGMQPGGPPMQPRPQGMAA